MMSRSPPLSWEYARHFLPVLSQFSNKREAGGMCCEGCACSVSLVFCDSLMKAEILRIRFPTGKLTDIPGRNNLNAYTAKMFA